MKLDADEGGGKGAEVLENSTREQRGLGFPPSIVYKQTTSSHSI
jgi:hypothetical protein